MHGYCRHIGAGRHGGNRHILPEIEMGSVGLVRKTQHSGGVGHLHNLPEIAADSVVGGVIDQNGNGVRMLFYGLLHLFPAHSQGNSQPALHLRVYVYRYGAAENQGIDDTPMNISRQNDLIPPLAAGKHHALHGTGGAAHHQERVGRAEGVRCQVLRLPDHRDRMAQVIQGLHAVYIHANASLSQKCGELRIAPPVLMSRHIKGNHPHLAEPLQCLINWCSVLIHVHGISCPFCQILCNQ